MFIIPFRRRMLEALEAHHQNHYAFYRACLLSAHELFPDPQQRHELRSHPVWNEFCELRQLVSQRESTAYKVGTIRYRLSDHVAVCDAAHEAKVSWNAFIVDVALYLATVHAEQSKCPNLHSLCYPSPPRTRKRKRTGLAALPPVG